MISYTARAAASREGNMLKNMHLKVCRNQVGCFKGLLNLKSRVSISWNGNAFSAPNDRILEPQSKCDAKAPLWGLTTLVKRLHIKLDDMSFQDCNLSLKLNQNIWAS